jgi:hypothetical protein
MLATCQRSAYSCNHAEFQKVYHQKQATSVKQGNVCDGRGEAYYFGARTLVLV